MDRISINLLPSDLKENSQIKKKKKLINLISIFFLSGLIVLTLGLIIFSVLQNKKLTEEKLAVKNLENSLTNLKETEAAVVILKKRLSIISSIMNQPSPQTDSFLIITGLMPENLEVQTINIDQPNIVNIQGFAPNAETMQKFLDNLTDPTINEGKIAKTAISNLNRGTAPRLGFDLAVTTKPK